MLSNSYNPQSNRLLYLFAVLIFALEISLAAAWAGVFPNTHPQPATIPSLSPSPTQIISPAPADEQTDEQIKSLEQRFLEVNLQKTIGNKTYVFRNGKNASGNTDYYTTQFGTLDDKQVFIPFPDEILQGAIEQTISANVTDFWFDEDSKRLFLVQNLGRPLSFANSQGFFQITFSPNQETKHSTRWEMIYSNQPGMYAGSSLLYFYPEQELLLVSTIGGDGCASWGHIWTLNLSGEAKTISQVSGGCNSTAPRFGGLVNGQLIFGEVVKPEQQGSPNAMNTLGLYTQIGALYATHPLTGKRSLVYEFPAGDIFDLLQPPHPLSHIPKVNEGEILLYGARTSQGTQETKYYAFDITTKTFRELPTQ